MSILQALLCKLGLHNWGPTRTIFPTNYIDQDGKWVYNPGGSYRFCRGCHITQELGVKDAGK